MCPNASTKEQLMLKGFIKDRYNMPVTAPSQELASHCTDSLQIEQMSVSLSAKCLKYM